MNSTTLNHESMLVPACERASHLVSLQSNDNVKEEENVNLSQIVGNTLISNW